MNIPVRFHFDINSEFWGTYRYSGVDTVDIRGVGVECNEEQLNINGNLICFINGIKFTMTIDYRYCYDQIGTVSFYKKLSIKSKFFTWKKEYNNGEILLVTGNIDNDETFYTEEIETFMIYELKKCLLENKIIIANHKFIPIDRTGKILLKKNNDVYDFVTLKFSHT